MPVAVDAVGPSSAGATANGLTVSYAHTVAGAERILLAGGGVGYGGADPAVSCTYAGVAMTPLVFRRSNDQPNAGAVVLFLLKAPPVGTANVVFTASATVDFSVGSVSFTGVDQALPIGTLVGAIQAATTPTVTVPDTRAGNMVFDVVGCGAALSADTQTMRWRRNTNAGTGAGNGTMSTAAGGGAVTLAHTIVGADWSTSIGGEIFASGGATDPALEGAKNMSAMAAMRGH